MIYYAFFLRIGKTSHSLIIRTQTFDENMNIKLGCYILQVELVSLSVLIAISLHFAVGQMFIKAFISKLKDYWMKAFSLYI